MNTEMLAKAIGLAGETHSVFVTTAAPDGLPHLAIAGEMTCGPEGQVSIREWFCPGTMNNLQENRCVSLVVWDADADGGYQLLGEVDSIVETGVLNGYDPQAETVHPCPQVCRQLNVRVGKVIRFSRSPHSDIEQ